MKNLWMGIVLLFAAGAPGRAQNIVMATMAPEQSVWYKVMANMGEEWKKISGGKVMLNIRPGGVMGDETEYVRRIKTHSIQAAGLTSAGLSEVDNGIECLQIPMLFDSYEELDYVRDKIGPKIEQRLAQKNMVVLNWGDVGWVHFFSTSKVTNLNDLRKLRLFTWAGNATEVELWRANHFNVVPMQAVEILPQLRARNLDAVPTTPLYADKTSLYTMTPYMCDVKWAAFVGGTVIDKDVWDKIPEAQRVQMLAAARKAGDALKNDVRLQGTQAIATMTAGQPGARSKKLAVTHPDDAAMAEWRRETEAVYPVMREKMVPPDLFDEAVRLHNEYRAKAKPAAAPASTAPAPTKQEPAKKKKAAV